jgi:serine/threonine protein phosphatase PrpC
MGVIHTRGPGARRGLQFLLFFLLAAAVLTAGLFAAGETAAPSPDTGESPAAGMESAAPEASALEAALSPSPSPADAAPTPGSAAAEESVKGAAPDWDAVMAFITAYWIFFAGGFVLLLLLLLLLAARRRAARKRRAQGAFCMENSSIRSAVFQNIGSYDKQEDSYYLSQCADPDFIAHHGVLAIMADGMGGLSDGAEVSGLVVSVFAQLFPQLPAAMKPSDKLLYMTHCANNEVTGRFGGQPGRSGSTLIAAILQGGGLWLLSIGDSRVALVRDGGLIPRNRERTYAAELDVSAAAGLIAYSEAAEDPQRRALTSYIGMGELALIDFTNKPIQLLPGDWVLLMSDGVCNELSDEEIVAVLSDDLEESAKRLEKAVLDKRDPGQDNFTALLLRYI